MIWVVLALVVGVVLAFGFVLWLGSLCDERNER